MHQREPEKFEWYCLQKEKLEQEEAEQEDNIDPTSEEDFDESMESGTSNELGAHWEWGGSTLSTLCHVLPLLCLQMPVDF